MPIKSIRKIIPFFLPFVIAAAVFAMLGIRATQAVTVPGSITQTDATDSATGFNLAGNAKTNTQVIGTGDTASVGLLKSSSGFASQQIATGGGSGGGSALSSYWDHGKKIAVDSSGNAHMLVFKNNGFFRYYKYSPLGVKLTEYPIGGSGGGNDSSLALDSSGNPHIAYQDTTGGLKYIYWTGTSWSATQAIDAVGGYGVDIALDSGNVQHIIYNVYVGVPNDYLKYAKYVTSGGNCGPANSWSCSIAATGIKDNPLISSLALDSANNPHILYNRYYSGDAGAIDFTCGYVKWNGTGWVKNAPPASCYPINLGRNPSLFLDSSNNPTIAYVGRNAWNGIFGLRSASYNGTSWGDNLIEAVTETGSFRVSAVFAINGAHMAYTQGAAGTARYAKYVTSGGNCGPANSWSCETVASNINSYSTSQTLPIHLSINASGDVGIKYYKASGTADSDNLASRPFSSPGTYTSGVLDSGQASDFTTVGWNATTPAFTGVTMEMRAGANSTVDGTWTAFSAVTNGTDTGATFDGKQHAQYRATLTTSNGFNTPSLNDITISYLVPGTFNFAAAITPQPGSVMKNGTITVSPGITASLTYGTAAPDFVTFSVDKTTADGDPSDLPAGVDVIFGNSPCSPILTTATPTCVSALTVTTSAATPLGSYVIPIKASVVVDAQNTIIKEATYAFTVTEPFDFSLNWTGTSSGTVTQGGNIPANFAAAKTAGSTSEPVTFSYNTGVQGVSVAFSPYTSCAPSDTCPGALTADIRTTFTGGAGDTPSGGPYLITVTATAGTLSKSIPFYLTVTPGFNFSMALNNTSDAIYAGDATAQLTTLTTKYESGSPGTVSYTITNPNPTNITITPSPLAAHAFSTVGETFSHPQLSISVSPSFIPITQTTYSIIIAGTSGTGLTHYATYVLTIYPPFDFTMQFSSPSTGNFNAAATPQDSDSGTAYQGEMVSQVISLTFNSPLPQVVNLTGAINIAGSNISANPSPSQCTSQYCTVMLPIITSDTTPKNTYTITVTGTGGGKTHTVTHTLTVNIPPFDYNMRGWAFSDGIGWISFSSRNCDIDWDGVMDRTNVGSGNGDASADAQCPPDSTIIPNYGAHLDPSSYELSGWAWSEHIGWITFEKTIAGTPPKAPYNSGAQTYIALLEGGTIKGWARAISCPGTECDTNSEWGWIKMSGTATNGSPYGVGNATSDLTGFAWGGHAIGWISFNSQNCDTDNNGTWDACGLSGAAYPYKVSVLSTLPNAPPECINLESNFLNRCIAPLTPKFSCMYRDNEGDPLAMFIINIYDATTNALVAGPLYVPGPTITDTFPLTQYDPLPNIAIPITYSYSGTALQYGRTYYFTVEVRDEAHLN